MPLNIKSENADRLARQLAEATGETLTEAVTVAIRDRLARIEGRRRSLGLREGIERMQERITERPRLDERTDEEILDYDASGLPR